MSRPSQYVARPSKITVDRLYYVCDFSLFCLKRSSVVARQNPRCIAFECAYYRRRCVLSYFVKSFWQNLVSAVDAISVGCGTKTLIRKKILRTFTDRLRLKRHLQTYRSTRKLKSRVILAVILRSVTMNTTASQGIREFFSQIRQYFYFYLLLWNQPHPPYEALSKLEKRQNTHPLHPLPANKLHINPAPPIVSVKNHQSTSMLSASARRIPNARNNFFTAL